MVHTTTSPESEVDLAPSVNYIESTYEEYLPRNNARHRAAPSLAKSARRLLALKNETPPPKHKA